MKKVISSALVGTLSLGIAFGVSAGPVEDQIAFQKYYEIRFLTHPPRTLRMGFIRFFLQLVSSGRLLRSFPHTS